MIVCLAPAHPLRERWYGRVFSLSTSQQPVEGQQITAGRMVCGGGSSLWRRVSAKRTSSSSVAPSAQQMVIVALGCRQMPSDALVQHAEKLEKCVGALPGLT